MGNFIAFFAETCKKMGAKTSSLYLFLNFQLTWADIAVAALFDDFIESKDWGDVFCGSKCLKDLYHCVMSSPGIKKYVANRKKTAL